MSDWIHTDATRTTPPAQLKNTHEQTAVTAVSQIQAAHPFRLCSRNGKSGQMWLESCDYVSNQYLHGQSIHLLEEAMYDLPPRHFLGFI